MSGDRRTLLLALVAAAIAFGVHARALGVGFYSDDYQWLARMAPTVDRPLFVFTVFYRDFNPVLHASFVVDWLLGGGSAVAFHAGSLIVHAATTALVVRLAASIGGRPVAAFAAGLLWGVGVRLSETVLWPAARGHALASVFSLIGVLCLMSRLRRPVTASAAAFAAGLLAKETAIVPMLLAPWFTPDPQRRRKAAVVLGTLAAAFIAFNLLAKPDFHTAGEGAWAALRKLPYVVLRPLGLGDFYDFSATGFAIFLVLAAVIATALWRSPARLGLVWIALAAAMVLPLQKLSSRYLYLTSIGFPLAACGALAHPALDRLSPGLRKLAGGLLLTGAAGLVAANALLVQREIEDYRSLAEPYAACFAALRPAAAAMRPGETLVVVETRPRGTVAELARRIDARGTIRKLVPERESGVGGLIELADIVNAARPPGTGRYAVAADPDAPGPRTIVAWDGLRATPIDAIPPAPAGRVLAARLVPAKDYYRSAR